jgi:hypothetical protein
MAKILLDLLSRVYPAARISPRVRDSRQKILWQLPPPDCAFAA